MVKAISQTQAEKLFRPWWDSVEDHLVYGLVTLSLIVLPTAIIISTPLTCNFCKTISNISMCGENFTNKLPDPKLNWKWVMKECTLNGSVSRFMLYFPYILLFMAFSIYFIEHIFKKMFKNSQKLENLHMVFKSIKSQDEASEDKCMSRGKLFEVKENLRTSNTFFASYIFKYV